MKIKPVIKWSGSKRTQALKILEKVPVYQNYYEPFLGGGSIMYALNPDKAICSDICVPLIDLWKVIQENPLKLSEYYAFEWNRLQDEGHEVYYEIRDRFNDLFSPYDLLFLSRTCVNGLIRFNREGKFNNSLHHSRKGIQPETLKKIIFDWSDRIKNISFISGDYKEVTKTASEGDFIYLDPPYFNTKGRYYGTSTIDFDEFFLYLSNLNERGIQWMLSFDGKTTSKDYTIHLPDELYKNHYYIHSGNSAFKKVMEKENNLVYESLFTNY